MTRDGVTPPMRVETALRLLPPVDLLAPLRALVMTTSRARPGEAPFGTVGKRLVVPALLTELMPQATTRFTSHLSSVLTLALSALDALARGDADAAVRAYVDASRAEAYVGREAAALVWLEHALTLAESSPSRDAEIDVLRALGAHRFAAYDYAAAGRHFQRCFTLADAEGAADQAARAGLSLGALALALGNPKGAGAWFARAHEAAGTNGAMRGRAMLGQCEAHATSGDVAAAAAALAAAKALLEDVADDAAEHPADADCPLPLALALSTARLALLTERPDVAVAQYRVALAVALRGSRDARLALRVRTALARCLIALDRLADAEDEVRLAEEQAVVHDRPRELALLYIMLGEIRGRQQDEAGFVFFEQAIALARDVAPTPRVKVEACLAYARFRAWFDERDEAMLYVGRARELLQLLGDESAVARLDAEWGLSVTAR